MNERSVEKLIHTLAAIFLFVLFAGPSFFFHPNKTNAFGPAGTYASIAASLDGTKLILGTIGGSLYTSSDAGVTWIERTAAGSGTWYGVASSSDGTKLVASNYGGYIYTSADSGVTWTPQTGIGTDNWNFTSVSSDGTQLLVFSHDTMAFQMSTDSGATWHTRTRTGLPDFPESMSFSSDGTKIVATIGCCGHTSLYRSTDSGLTWSLLPATHNGTYYSNVVSSGDGLKITVGYTEEFYDEASENTYTNFGFDISSDGGQSWTSSVYSSDQFDMFPPRLFYLAMSGDGGTVVSTEIGTGRMEVYYFGGSYSAVASTLWMSATGYSISSDAGKIVAYNLNSISLSENGGANFSATPYVLTYTAGDHGSISGPTPQNIGAGGSGSSVTAVPVAGYHFASWSDASTTNPRTDTNILASHTYTASFAANPTYTLTYTAGAHGSITGTATQSILGGADGTAVTAVPEAGYSFVSWSDASTANPRTDVGITQNISVTASFVSNVTVPTVTAVSASAITTTTAMLNGTITATGGENVTVRGFHWGTTASYGSTTVANGSFSAGDFSANLTGLARNTTYHYQAYATNSAGTSVSSDAIFATNRVGTSHFTTIVAIPNDSSDQSNSGGGSVVLPPTPTSPEPVSIPPSPKPTPFLFTHLLRRGTVEVDVKMLQNFLNTHGFVLATSGVGSLGEETNVFGPLTEKAVSFFQVSHAKDILVPLGLTKPTGIFGPYTMKVVNAVLHN